MGRLSAPRNATCVQGNQWPVAAASSRRRLQVGMHSCISMPHACVHAAAQQGCPREGLTSQPLPLSLTRHSPRGCGPLPPPPECGWSSWRLCRRESLPPAAQTRRPWRNLQQGKAQ